MENTIKTRTEDILENTRMAQTSERCINENIDNPLQYARGGQVLVIFDETDNSISFIDNGIGFNDLSFVNYHKFYGTPEDTNGCSRYNYGSKTFVCMADEREMFSINKNTGRQYSSQWNYKRDKDLWRHMPPAREEEMKNILSSNGFSNGSVVKLNNVYTPEYSGMSDLCKKTRETAQKRYEYYLHIYKTRLSFRLIMKNGTVQDFEIEPKDIFNKNKNKIPRSYLDRDNNMIEFYSYYSPEESGVGNQGIKVFYDYILITTKPWLRYTSRNGFVNRSNHNAYNNIRQAIFLNSQNASQAQVSSNKDDCIIVSGIKNTLVSDFDKIFTYCKNLNKAKSKSKIKKQKGKNHSFSSADTEQVFLNTWHSAPWKQKDGEIIFNEDSQFFEKFLELNNNHQNLFYKFVEYLYVCSDNSRKVKDFIKKFSVEFENSLD